MIGDIDINEISLNEVNAAICKQDFYFFVKEFWETVPGYKKYKDNWHVKYLCEVLQEAGMRLIKEEKKQGDIYVSMPPGLGKSFVLILFKCWLFALKPQLQIIGASYSQAISNKDHAFKTRDVLKSDKFQKYFPYFHLKEDKTSVGDFYTSLNGSHFATSPESSVTGKRYELLVLDDPLNIHESYNDKIKENTNQWVDDLYTRQLDGDYSLMIIVQQRLAHNDTIGHLLAKNENNAIYICLPAEYNQSLSPAFLKPFYDERDGLLFPSRQSREFLEGAKKTSSRSYAAQYLQNPLDDSNAMIKAKDFPLITKEDFADLVKDKPLTIDFFIDVGGTANTRNDPSVIIAAAKVGELVYVLDIWRGWKEMNQLIEQLKYFVSYNGYRHNSRIYIETDGIGLPIYQQIREATSLNIVKTNNNKISKAGRLEIIATKTDSKRIILLKDNWNKTFLDEVTGFSNHDDQQDALFLAVSILLGQKQGSGKYHYTFC